MIPDVSSSDQRAITIAAILPPEPGIDEERRLHEAVALLESLGEHQPLSDASAGCVASTLAEFAACPASKCAQFVRERRKSPFAGDENEHGTLLWEMKTFKMSLRSYEQKKCLPRSSRTRQRLLLAAFLLLLEVRDESPGQGGPIGIAA